jgi:hypothetical protein
VFLVGSAGAACGVWCVVRVLVLVLVERLAGL